VGEWENTRTTEREMMPSEREYFEEIRDESFAAARESGCEVIVASPSQIQLDIDQPWPVWAHLNSDDPGIDVLNVLAATAGERNRDVLARLLEFVVVISWEAWRSTSGNTHIMLTLSHEFTPHERVAMQAMLGSDPMRELLNLRRVWCGADDPIALFRPKKEER